MLIDLISPLYANSAEMCEIQLAIEGQYNALSDAVDNLGNQLYINSATDELAGWEQFYGVETDITAPIEYRRTKIIAKIRGSGTSTVEMIKNVAESFANGEVDVTEQSDQYVVTITFVSTKGAPPNIDDLKRAIEDVIPAHLSINYVYIYTTHAELTSYTHSQLAQYTHAEIRVLQGG